VQAERNKLNRDMSASPPQVIVSIDIYICIETVPPGTERTGFGEVAGRGSLIGGRGEFGFEFGQRPGRFFLFVWRPTQNLRGHLYLLHPKGLSRLRPMGKKRNFRATTGLKLV
jgi:hypothetical protein